MRTKAMISREEQLKLFDKYGTPEHVRRHCDAVASAAFRIAEALNAAGYELDAELVKSAARVHDLLRVMDDHAERGAVALEKEGYAAEAQLVRYHMNHHPFNEPDEFNELDALCLADRVVKEDEYVGIEARIEYLVSKPGVTADRAERIRSVMAYTKNYISEIEKRAGKTLDEIVKG